MGETGGNGAQKNILATAFGVLSAAQEKPGQNEKESEE